MHPNVKYFGDEHMIVYFFWKAGTGKTFLAKEIQSTLVGKKKTVFVTTSTGIAGRQFQFQSQTLHRWVAFM